MTGRSYYTRDTHEKNYLDTQEGKLLPVPTVSLVRKDGNWCPRSRELAGDHIYDKPTFGSVELCYGLKEAMLDEEVEARREPDRVHHAGGALHGYLCDLQRHAAEGLLPGSAGDRGRFLLRGGDAGES